MSRVNERARRPRLASWAAACALLVAAVPAGAQPSAPKGVEKAQALFESALKMMDNGEYGPACALLEQSEKLDPGMGTRFRLAECFEKIGRVASAWTMFIEVAYAAKEGQLPERERVARQRAAALEPRLARLRLKLSPDVAALPGLEVTADGQTLSPEQRVQPTPIDPGEHTIEVVAAGKKPWQGSILIDRPSETFELDVPRLEDALSAPSPPRDAPPPPPIAPKRDQPGNGRKVAGIAIGVAGVAGLAVSGVFAAIAASQWSDATAQCAGGRHDRCTPEGIALGKDASSSATISTIAFAAGLAGVGAGLAIWLTAPSAPPAAATAQRWILAPSVGRSGAGCALRVAY